MSKARKIGARYGEAMRKLVVQLYVEKKLSVDRIAHMPGMPTTKTVCRILDEAKVERRSSVRFDRAAIIADIRKRPDATLTDFARKWGCSTTFVMRLRAEDRVENPPPPRRKPGKKTSKKKSAKKRSKTSIKKKN